MILKIKVAIFTGINILLRNIYPIKIMNTENSIQYIKNTGKSLCRFGEGEMGLLARKKDLKFQKYDEKLAERMKEILVTDLEDVAIAIPLAIKKCDDLNERAKKFWLSDTSYSMVDWVKYTKFRKVYLDSLMTRIYIDLKDRSKSPHYYNMWKSIWEDRKILVVEGKESRLGVGNDLFSNVKEIQRILCPSVNAFEYYDIILDKAKKYNKEFLILIALGPTASILAYDLTVCGFQALDIGHIDVEYEWYKMGVEVPTKISGKYTNEVFNGNIVEDNQDEEYLKQIVEIIG